MHLCSRTVSFTRDHGLKDRIDTLEWFKGIGETRSYINRDFTTITDVENVSYNLPSLSKYTTLVNLGDNPPPLETRTTIDIVHSLLPGTRYTSDDWGS